MAKVYLDTSFISACVTSRTDVASLYRRERSHKWMETQAQHEVFISAEVLNELSHPSYLSREAALELAGRFALVAVSDEVLGFAAILVREKLMPAPVEGDAIHVAAVCVHRPDCLLTCNVRHLANQNKREHLARTFLRAGVVPPQIMTPDLMLEV